MGTLYLVRHAQASLGADNYDQLSELGLRQSRRLGEYFHAKGIRFDAVFSGTLQRHRQTLEGIAQGMQWQPADVQRLSGLNEYDSEAVIAAVHPAALARPDTPELVRHHFRLLRQGLGAWMDGQTKPRGMPDYRAFVQGVVDALDRVRASHAERVLLVSSGGPIATAVGQVLGTAARTTIELNLRMRNSSITEFVFNPKQHRLETFNHLPHLDHADYTDWITYA